MKVLDLLPPEMTRDMLLFMDTSFEIRERHIRLGRYIKDAVYAANDGIVTTFAVVAATVGGALSPATILIVGIANLFADGFSMASGNYLGMRSERDLYEREEAEEKKEVKQIPDEERQEVRGILVKKGYSGRDLEEMTRLITAREEYWIRFMMQEELKLHNPEDESPVRSGSATFISFVLAGSIPLLPYVLFGAEASFLSAAASTAAALFIVGALRAYFSRQSWFILGFEMLLVGGSAAAIAYGIGFLLRSII